jgi:inorganic pyrophosphatase
VRVLLLEDLISDRGREHGPSLFQATAVLESAMTAVSTTVSEPIKVAISSFDLIGSTHDAVQPIAFQEGATKPIELDAVVEVPRGSFLKRGSTGKVDFISPVPCPFNYGSVPQYLGREGDLLDAVVLGPRLPYGSHVRVKVWGAVILTDHGMSDDKLICSSRRRPGRNACEGWCEAEQAMARARPRPATWQGPPVKF